MLFVELAALPLLLPFDGSPEAPDVASAPLALALAGPVTTLGFGAPVRVDGVPEEAVARPPSVPLPPAAGGAANLNGFSAAAAARKRCMAAS